MTDKTIDQLTLLLAPSGADVAASKTNTDYRIRVGEANGLATLDGTGKVPSGQLPAPSGTTWGSITGTLSSQTDLNSALAGKAATSHTHTFSQITDLSSYTGFDARYYTETETNTLLNAKATLAANANFRDVVADRGDTTGAYFFGASVNGHSLFFSGTSYQFNGSSILLVGGNTVWHNGNDGTGSTLDADMVDGFHANATAGTANAIPVRNGSGHIANTYFTMSANVTAATPTRIVVDTGSDEILRWQTPASFITNLDLAVKTPSVQTVASTATLTPVETNDLVVVTAQAASLSIANPTGTWVQGQGLVIRIKDNGTARAISWGTNYRAIGTTLPTTTTINKTKYIGIIYNSTDAKWDVVSVATEA